MDSSSETARFNMIQQQVRPWRVLDDRVLDVMAEIGREHFVPDAYQGLAYADIEVPIAEGRAMLAPGVVGRMLQALNVQSGEKVLEIGTGTGYVAACLSRLGGPVVGVEIDPELAAGARERLAALGLTRIEILEADALAGPIAGAPFNVIAVNGSLPTAEPLALLEDQLALGGRLFCIVGDGPVMEARLVTRVGARDFRREDLFETAAPPLPQVPEPQGFEF
ncbi:MAG: protein-L-isoaspartate O-methyltransferase [Chromatiaceae bacterium]